MSDLSILEIHTEQLRRIETDVAQIRKQLGDFSISQFSEKLGNVHGRTLVWSGIVSVIIAAAMGIVFSGAAPKQPEPQPFNQEQLSQIIQLLEQNRENMPKAGGRKQ